METQKDGRTKTAIVMFAILLASYMCNAMDRQIFSAAAERRSQGIQLYDL